MVLFFLEQQNVFEQKMIKIYHEIINVKNTFIL